MQVQELDLASTYCQRDDVQHFCGMLDGLALLLISDLAEGMKYVREQQPQDVPELADLVNYFDATYVSGVLRPARNTDPSRLLLQLTRTPPTFPALMWNQHRATVDGTERTNNACEGWNHSFATNIGHQHPSLWTLLGALQQDQAVVATQLLQNALGQPPAKRQKKSVASHQERLQNLCMYPRDGCKSVAETLRTLGHCVRLM